jgi:hypothetical protein
VKRDLGELRVQGEESGNMTEVWVPKEEGWVDNETGLLRVNALSLDAKQEGLDLREWVEKKWVQYCNGLDEVPQSGKHDKPHQGGAY